DLPLVDVERGGDAVVGVDQVDPPLVARAGEDLALAGDGDGGEVGVGERVQLLERAVRLDAKQRALAAARALARELGVGGLGFVGARHAACLGQGGLFALV